MKLFVLSPILYLIKSMKNFSIKESLLYAREENSLRVLCMLKRALRVYFAGE